MSVIEHKVGWRFWFFLIFLAAVLPLGVRVICMLLSGEIVMEDNSPISPLVAWGISAILCFPLLTYFISVLTMLRQVIVYKRRALTITYEGLENTLTFVNLFAFILVVPIKFIPWEAINYYDDKEKFPCVRVSVKQIKASPIAKAILFVRGYMFCANFCKPIVTHSEIDQYKHRFRLKD